MKKKCLIYKNLDTGSGSSSPFTGKIRAILFYVISVMVTDNLATQGASSSAAIVLTSGKILSDFFRPERVWSILA